MEQVTVRGCTLWLPALDDVKLLWACLVWPIPSYVSDATSAGSATSPGGQFWWRVPLRECGKLSFSSLRLEEGVVAFPCFIGIQAVEAVVMLSYVTHKLMLSDQNLLGARPSPLPTLHSPPCTCVGMYLRLVPLHRHTPLPHTLLLHEHAVVGPVTHR
jgi:hypothetical protein